MATDVQPPAESGSDTRTPLAGGPGAIFSVLCGLLALVFAFMPRGHYIASGFGILGVALGVAVLRRVRRDGGAGRELAVAGVALALLSTAGMLASQAAFGTVIDRGTDPAAAPAAPGPSASQLTKDVLAKELKIEIGKWALGLDSSGITTASLALTVTNKSKQTKSFDLRLEALNSKGKRLTVDAPFVQNLGAGQSANIVAFNIVNNTLAPELKGADVRVVEAISY